MKIEWVNACRAVRQNPDGTWAFDGFGMDGGLADKLPAEAAGFLVLAISVGPYDNAPMELTVSIISPDMETDLEVIQRFHPPTRGPAHPEGHTAQAIMPIAFKFPVTQTGDYTLRAALDDQSSVSWPFMVSMAAAS